MVKQTAVPNQFNMKNRSAEQKSHDKKGSRAKKSQKNCSEFAAKNVPCVNGIIEIALEQIQCDIAANS